MLIRHLACAALAAALTACGDDASTTTSSGTGTGGEGGATGSAGESSAGGGAPIAATGTGTATGAGTGTTSGSGTATGTGTGTDTGSASGTATGTGTATGAGGGSGTGGAAGCTGAVVVTDEEDLAECSGFPDRAVAIEGTLTCPDDESIWPIAIYAVDVQVGDCVFMQADNLGSEGTDLFGAIVDPGGSSLLFDEELACAVPVPGEYACPEGAATAITAGRAHVAVGIFPGEGCPAGEETPYQLLVGVNGFGAEATFVCEGDVDQLFP